MTKMRRISIFLYFLTMVMVSIRLSNFFGLLTLIVLFLFFYSWAEELDEDEDDNF
jgi:hypothetical protein